MPFNPTTLFLAMQTALMGYIPAELRALGIRSVGKHGLQARWFFDTAMTETLEDIVSTVMMEAESYLPSQAGTAELDSDVRVVVDSTEDVLEQLPSEEWVFYRYDGHEPELPKEIPELPLERLRMYIATKALLGCVQSNVRRVSLAIAREQTLLRYYIDGLAGDAEQQLAKLAAERLSHLLRMSFEEVRSTVTSDVVRVDVPHLLTQESSKVSVYDRYEDDLIDWAHITPEQDQEFKHPEHFLS